ncbi:LuxR C-terminal-related transcriptional regulator [Spongiactinospora sp. TRM90649]|uniref:ATP-binding protein n=1 Tax=Spongiactinospora sp. TRM90649 TaxID=3031114 RepID=UPI0023FA4370|nr:LuxR C-terminal-related transcriptional regulator [Spongiactinospora sp. TRM90649]MDF5757977.1 LuxR C-terminal-related transcriptional regulator [Spongiactinospora sp. TRM90649]
MSENAGRWATGTLPAETTSFVGRAAELAAVKNRLKRARLVTLTGVGGVGKTRVAVRAAREVHESFPDGVCLVPLSALRDPALLPNTVAGAFGLPEQSGRPAIDLLAGHLSGKRLLLILDTCEHLIEDCATLADTLLRAVSDLRVLATSRRPLDVPGEHALPIAPLPVHAEGADGEAGAARDATALFADRAAAAAPGFALTDANRAQVAALCRRLDGIPLAIELAVARLRALTVEEILSRLDTRFLLLGGGRTTLPRHQTLKTTIDWSHELCGPDERVLWARLAVFAGEFGLDAVEEVCAGGDLPAERIMDALISLVDQSVVLRVDGETPGGARYRMLDTIREYGAERLAASGEAERYRGRHRDHYLGKVREFEAAWTGRRQLLAVRGLIGEQANVRLALETCLADPDGAAAGLELAVKLWGFWHCSGLLTEGRYWLRRVLAAAPEPSPARVLGLLLTVWFMDLQGEPGDTRPLVEEAARTARDIGDEYGMAWCVAFSSHTSFFRGDPRTGIAGFTEARRRLALLGDETAMVITGFQMAFMHFLAGDAEAAIEACDDALRRIEAPDECWMRSWSLWVKGIALWGRGDRRAAVECARAAIVLKQRLNDLIGIAHCLEVIAWGAAAGGRHERSAVLLGAADRLWRKAATEPRFGSVLLQEFLGEAVEACRTALGEEEYAQARARGSAAEVSEAVSWALGEEEAGDAERPSWELLSRRERQVAALVAEGLTNREIAAKLVISKRTADAHVEHILSKLGVSSRTQVAALAPGLASGLASDLAPEPAPDRAPAE